MDPNATLERIRELAATVRSVPGSVLAPELAAHVEALDVWLTRGGFLPTEWRDAPKES